MNPSSFPFFASHRSSSLGRRPLTGPAFRLARLCILSPLLTAEIAEASAMDPARFLAAVSGAETLTLLEVESILQAIGRGWADLVDGPNPPPDPSPDAGILACPDAVA